VDVRIEEVHRLLARSIVSEHYVTMGVYEPGHNCCALGIHYHIGVRGVQTATDLDNNTVFAYHGIRMKKPFFEITRDQVSDIDDG
jgi:hypothetical protein